jgi:hypothetical protein
MTYDNPKAFFEYLDAFKPLVESEGA